MNKLDGNQAGRNEQKKLTAYLRDKARHGENLNAQERNTAQKLRVDVQSGNFSLSGPVEFKASPNITQNQTQLLSLF